MERFGRPLVLKRRRNLLCRRGETRLLDRTRPVWGTVLLDALDIDGLAKSGTSILGIEAAGIREV
jgi:hypothetical protein